ncbi:YtxH domain-containing protein [Blattabacterium cuenoti]|uniref:YtxH domain-containing protein n=1 Tax=Blattabacterium cuenoti TaxID=1653831 RepID=UPI00163D211A|nr:YtxH domain-containing protein [Blattabacterium cuenoti]
MKRGGNFFWGFLIGTMAGLVMGIMFIPRKEEKIKNILGEKKEELKDNFQEISKKIGKKVDQIKSNFEKMWKKNKIDKEKIDQIEDELGT